MSWDATRETRPMPPAQGGLRASGVDTPPIQRTGQAVHTRQNPSVRNGERPRTRPKDRARRARIAASERRDALRGVGHWGTPLGRAPIRMRGTARADSLSFSSTLRPAHMSPHAVIRPLLEPGNAQSPAPVTGLQRAANSNRTCQTWNVSSSHPVARGVHQRISVRDTITAALGCHRSPRSASALHVDNVYELMFYVDFSSDFSKWN